MLVNSKKMLKEAKKNKKAVFQFNINNLEWTRYILEECDKLKAEETAVRQEETSVKTERGQIDLIVDELDSFEKSFQTMNIVKKREYLKMLLDKVVWDGEKAQIFLYGSHWKE